jgi:4-hydroxybenzoate polyprenyltransferase
MLRSIRDFLEMIRFSHTLFALPFALLAAVMAWSVDPHPPFNWLHLVGLLAAMTSARSFSMAANRLADRDLDARNPRTARRHLPAGVLTVRSVTWFMLGSAAVFVASTACFWPNRWPLALSLPVLAFLGGYSYAKRFTSYSHVWLGAALMLAPLCAWVAIRGGVDEWPIAWPPVVLSAAVLLWVTGFDVIYACQDFEFDVKAGLHSLPAALGVGRALKLAAGCHVLMVFVLALLPWVLPPLGLIYWLGIIGVATLLIVEHLLVRPDDLSRVNQAFFHVNGVISIGLLIVGAIDLLI